MTSTPASDSVLIIPEVPPPTRKRVVMLSTVILVLATLVILEILWFAPWWAWAMPAVLTLMTILIWPTPDVLVDLARKRVARPPMSDLGFEEVVQVELLPTVIADSLPNRRLTEGPAWAVVLRGRLEGRDTSSEPYCDAEIPRSVLGTDPRGLDAVVVTAQHPLSSGFAWAKRLARSFGVPLRVDLGDLHQRFDCDQLDQSPPDRCTLLGNGHLDGAPVPDGVRETTEGGTLRLRWNAPVLVLLMSWAAAFGGAFGGGLWATRESMPPAARAAGYVLLALSVVPLWRVLCLSLLGGRCSIEVGPKALRTVCAHRWVPIRTIPLEEFELVHGQVSRPGALPELGSPTVHAVVVLGRRRSAVVRAEERIASWVPARVHRFLAS